VTTDPTPYYGSSEKGKGKKKQQQQRERAVKVQKFLETRSMMSSTFLKERQSVPRDKLITLATI
jgi:hypothetical protein